MVLGQAWEEFAGSEMWVSGQAEPQCAKSSGLKREQSGSFEGVIGHSPLVQTGQDVPLRAHCRVQMQIQKPQAQATGHREEEADWAKTEVLRAVLKPGWLSTWTSLLGSPPWASSCF